MPDLVPGDGPPVPTDREVLDALFGSDGAALAWLDLEGRVVRASGGLAGLNGRPAADLRGLSLFSLYPLVELEGMLARVAAGGRPESWPSRPLVPPSHPERGTSWWDVSVHPIRADGAVQGLLVSLVEATGLHRARALLREEEQRFRQIAGAMLDGLVVMDDQGRITEWNPAASRIFGYEEEEVKGRDLHELLVPPRYREATRRGLLGFRSAGSGPVLHRVLELEGLRRDGSEFPMELSVAPLLVQGREHAVGVVRDVSRRPEAEEARCRPLLETIQALARAVESRDPHKAGHQQRVALLAATLAGMRGLAAEPVEGLRLAALIHDVGEIGVPEEILLWPGPLESWERAVLQGHVEAGCRLVQGIAFPWPVAEVIRQHHERLDGSGYPLGLRGGEILPEARILAVADVMAALCSPRCHRPALGLEEALAELGRHRGTLYDGDVVNCCRALFEEGGFSFPG